MGLLFCPPREKCEVISRVCYVFGSHVHPQDAVRELAGELVGLQWDDISTDRLEVVIRRARSLDATGVRFTGPGKTGRKGSADPIGIVNTPNSIEVEWQYAAGHHARPGLIVPTQRHPENLGGYGIYRSMVNEPSNRPEHSAGGSGGALSNVQRCPANLRRCLVTDDDDLVDFSKLRPLSRSTEPLGR